MTDPTMNEDDPMTLAPATKPTAPAALPRLAAVPGVRGVTAGGPMSMACRPI